MHSSYISNISNISFHPNHHPALFRLVYDAAKSAFPESPDRNTVVFVRGMAIRSDQFRIHVHGTALYKTDSTAARYSERQ
jgi:hypothetical protein